MAQELSNTELNTLAKQVPDRLHEDLSDVDPNECLEIDPELVRRLDEMKAQAASK